MVVPPNEIMRAGPPEVSANGPTRAEVRNESRTGLISLVRQLEQEQTRQPINGETMKAISNLQEAIDQNKMEIMNYSKEQRDELERALIPVARTGDGVPGTKKMVNELGGIMEYAGRDPGKVLGTLEDGTQTPGMVGAGFAAGALGGPFVGALGAVGSYALGSAIDVKLKNNPKMRAVAKTVLNGALAAGGIAVTAALGGSVLPVIGALGLATGVSLLYRKIAQMRAEGLRPEGRLAAQPA